MYSVLNIGIFKKNHDARFMEELYLMNEFGLKRKANRKVTKPIVSIVFHKHFKNVKLKYKTIILVSPLFKIAIPEKIL